SNDTVKVWDAASGQEILTCKGHTDQVTHVAFSPDGKNLASASKDETVKMRDALSGQKVLSLKHATEDLSVDSGPDGKRLASASMDDNTVKIWDLASGKVLTLTGGPYHLAFSPDGKRLAGVAHSRDIGAGKANTMKLWDTVSGQEVLSLRNTGTLT